MGFSLTSLFAPVLAAGEHAGYLGTNGLLVVGVALIVFGAARGIATIASHAVESIARQPEAGGRIFTSMIISAALIEGFTFFALFVAMGGVIKA